MKTGFVAPTIAAAMAALSLIPARAESDATMTLPRMCVTIGITDIEFSNAEWPYSYPMNGHYPAKIIANEWEDYEKAANVATLMNSTWLDFAKFAEWNQRQRICFKIQVIVEMDDIEAMDASEVSGEMR